MKKKVEDEIARLEKDGVIEPVKFSDWAAPIVPVLKPNGQVRICGDYSVTVNKVSKLEQYPIPTLEDLIAQLGKGTVFHKLDLSHAYSQVELEPESRKFVTINTHKGLFQYTRLPYGVSSAPAQFQRVMESVLKGIPSTVVYFDDILVTGETADLSYQNLDLVLDRLDKAGLKLKRDKCTFGAEEVTFLGHKISKFGIEPMEEKVQALVQAKPPENVQQLKAYLGLLNYYGRFLKNLSGELHALHKLLRKGVKWRWGTEQQSCFEKTKKMILSAKVLVHYDPNRSLVLHTDASQYGVGAVLSHVMEDGSEHPIGFVSKTLNAAEKKYSQLDKEGAAVVFGLKKFHKYLYGRKFSIVTDHKPLLTLFGEHKQVPTLASPRIQRWSVILRAYEYTMEYRSGKAHANADCFSRLPLPEMEAEEQEEKVLLIDELEDCSVLSARQIRDWTRRDPVLAHVHDYLLRGWPQQDRSPELNPYRIRKDELSVQDGCVLWGARVVVPQKGRQQVLQELHTAHPGMNRMKGLARSYVWWPGMDKDIELMVHQCSVCQEHQKSPVTAPLHPWEYPDGPWKRVHIDYAGPFMGEMLLIVVDAYSKFIEVGIMKQTTSSATIRKLREIFAEHGLPDMIVSDNGANFTSREFAAFMQSNGIVHVKTAPYHPSSNGLAERAVQTVKEGVKKTAGDSFHMKLHRFLLRYRITPQSSTGRSPAELLFQRRLKTRLDLLHPTMQGKVHKQQLQMKQQHDKNKPERHFQVGDLVSVKNFGVGPQWISGTVVKISGPVSFEVLLADGRRVRRHVDQILRRYVQEEPDTAKPEMNNSGSPVLPCPTASLGLPQIHDSMNLPSDSGSRSEPLSVSSGSDGKEGSSEGDSISGVEGHVRGERSSVRERKPPAYLSDYVCFVDR
jgi:transposase InsO family protein